MDLPGEHASRRARYDDLHLFGIEHAAHEALPAGYDLDLVEQPEHGRARAQLRVAPVVLLEHESQLIDSEVGQAVIVETEVERLLGRRHCPAVPEELTEERGLARATHPDDRMRLARYRRQSGVAGREFAGRRGAEGRAELLEQHGVKGHETSIVQMCPSVKDTFVITCPYRKDRLCRLNRPP
jgi:hypothetical protein